MKKIENHEVYNLTEILKVRAENYGVSKIANIVLDNPQFSICSGSSTPDAHHYGDHGLLRHTYEVISLSFHILNWYIEQWFIDKRNIDAPGTCPDTIQKELFLAGLYHDVGKIWDHDKVDEVCKRTIHKTPIHHIQRSAIEWAKAVSQTDTCHDIEDKVTHAILSHHGQRDWGSPVSPKTRLAWFLHLSDQLSARIDDGETNFYLQNH